MTFNIDIADFANFCRGKGEATYDYGDCCGCALATYLIEAKGMTAGYGANTFSVGGGYVSVRGPDSITAEHRFSDDLKSALYGGDYKGLAERLEAMLPAASASPWTTPAAYLAFAEPVS